MQVLSHGIASYKRAAETIMNGGICILPTDTVYGIAALPSPKSIEKIHKIKQRSEKKPFVAHFYDTQSLIQASCYTVEEILFFLDLIPGPLTLLSFPSPKFSFDPCFSYAKNKIGLRIPQSDWISVFSSLGVPYPLILTSANTKKFPPATRIQDIESEVMDQVEIVVEHNKKTNNMLLGIESSIIEMKSKQSAYIYRYGCMFCQLLEKSQKSLVSIEKKPCERKKCIVLENKHRSCSEIFIGTNLSSKSISYNISKSSCFLEAYKNFYTAIHTLIKLNTCCISIDNIPFTSPYQPIYQIFSRLNIKKDDSAFCYSGYN